MIEITTEQFEQALPFVGPATEEVFHRMRPTFDSVYCDLVANTIGSDHEEESIREGAPLLHKVRDYVMLATMLLRLRSHDLILTDNGFGVVSNENIAPASQARVDSLAQELAFRRDLALSAVINGLRQLDGWAATMQAYNTINSLLWSPQTLRAYKGVPMQEATFEELARHRAEISAAEGFLRHHLGDGLMDQMLEEERCATFAPCHRQAKLKMLDFIAANISIKGESIDPASRERSFDSLFRYIEAHLDDFALYRDSTAYTANHMQAYENDPTLSAFFFAG